MLKEAAPLSNVWVKTLADIIVNGHPVAPRGQRTLEIPQHTVLVDMLHPVLLVKERKLQYRFMAAEAHWILSGDNRVETIAPFNKNIGRFSDNGQTFDGAYGPRIQAQLDYVVEKLLEDPDTRQAVMAIWTPNPEPSKDIPCTVAFSFMVRGSKLNVHGFMRSSDAWLGLPYDAFNFSMLGALVCDSLNQRRTDKLSPGTLFLTLASSHLYEQHWADAEKIIDQSFWDSYSDPVPSNYYEGLGLTLYLLDGLKHTTPGHQARWWGAKDAAVS
jgi:thymidylate synthase